MIRYLGYFTKYTTINVQNKCKDNFIEIELNIKIRYYDYIFFTILIVKPFCIMRTFVKRFVFYIIFCTFSQALSDFLAIFTVGEN